MAEDTPHEKKEPGKKEEAHQEGGEGKEQAEWETLVTPPGKKKKKLAFAAVIVVLFVGASLFFAFVDNPITGFFVRADGAAAGDTVRVLYTGTLENGEVFDTTNEELGNEIGLERLSYEPLEFVVGSGYVIEGFDDAVLGMMVGEVVTVTLPPELAYGGTDPAMVVTSDREVEFNRTEEMPLETEIPAEQFIQVFGLKEIGEEFKVLDTEFTYRVLDISDTDVSVMIVLEVGEIYRFPGSAWNSTVVKISDGYATLRHNPGETEIQTEFGETILRYTEDKIIIRTNPIVGGTVMVPDRLTGGTITGIVINVTEASITVDMNHRLAGKTLKFEIELVEIIKGS